MNKIPGFVYKPGFICNFNKNDAYTVRNSADPPIVLTPLC